MSAPALSILSNLISIPLSHMLQSDDERRSDSTSTSLIVLNLAVLNIEILMKLF